MALIALLFSLFVAATGAVGLIFPTKLLAFARLFQHQAGLWIAGAFRVLFGAALFFSAPTSHAPEIIRILGVIIFVAGFITPFFGIKRVNKLLNWWEERGALFVRIWAFVALSIGLLLASALVT